MSITPMARVYHKQGAVMLLNFKHSDGQRLPHLIIGQLPLMLLARWFLHFGADVAIGAASKAI